MSGSIFCAERGEHNWYEGQHEGLSSVSLRLTAPSAEGVKGNFASAEARRWLSDRPRHPFGFPLISLYRTQRWQVAAALSAAVTTTNLQETASNLQGRIV